MTATTVTIIGNNQPCSGCPGKTSHAANLLCPEGWVVAWCLPCQRPDRRADVIWCRSRPVGRPSMSARRQRLSGGCPKRGGPVATLGDPAICRCSEDAPGAVSVAGKPAAPEAGSPCPGRSASAMGTARAPAKLILDQCLDDRRVLRVKIGVVLAGTRDGSSLRKREVSDQRL